MSRDVSPVIPVFSLLDTVKELPVPCAEDLVNLLRGVVMLSKGASETSSENAAENTDKISHNETKASASGKSQDAPARPPHEDSLALMQAMVHMRSLMVQLTLLHNNVATYQGAKEGAKKPDLLALAGFLCRDLPNIVSIAATDPVAAVTCAFSSGSFKGAQLDVLKNLLKDGDVCFLEKISIRIWRQLRHSALDSAGNKDGNGILSVVPVAGEVQITEGKVRALAHFPTVRLPGVSLKRMTGRWFYECTLLSDGLMQIGWADAMFRCDPVNSKSILEA